MEARGASVTPDREVPTLSSIFNRTLPPPCQPLNKGSISWGEDGCIAYGCGSLVAVVDVATAQYFQTLTKHKQAVVKTAWASRMKEGTEPHRRLILASADAGGTIIVWDVCEGQPIKVMQDGNQSIIDLCWIDSRLANSGHLLVAIHPPNHLVLWNTTSGSKVWKSSADEQLCSIDFDPFSCFKVMLRGPTCVMFVNDFHPNKCPKTNAGKKLFILGSKERSPVKGCQTPMTPVATPGGMGNSSGSALAQSASGYNLAAAAANSVASGSPGVISNGNERASKSTNTRSAKLSRIMRQMMLGETSRYPQQYGGSSGDGSGAAGGGRLSECLDARYHRAVKNQILLAFPKEVSIVDVELCQTIGVISLERAHSPLFSLQTVAASERIYILHESGSVSVWKRKPCLGMSLLTPAGSFRHSQVWARAQSCIPPQSSESGKPSWDSSTLSMAGSEMLLEVSYESKVQSDHVRMGKNCKVLGLAVNPIEEKSLAILTTDGRVFHLSLTGVQSFEEKPNQQVKEKLIITSMLGASSSTPTVVRMCPPLTVKNLNEYRPLLATGSPNGNILIYDVSTGVLFREIAVHTSAVRGLEWTTGNPAHSVLSFSHHAITGSNLVRNELVHCNIISGRVKTLRTDRGEESPLTMLRISQAKQYFVIAFAAAPFELWDLRKLSVLRTMPKKFPLVTAIYWSPLHASSKAKKRNALTESEKEDEGSQPVTKSPIPTPEEPLNLKEYILFTDQDTQLYHFSVEGHSIREGTKIPAETGLGTINDICCKSDLIVRGDSEGNINIWNIKERQSKNIHTGRGLIRRMRFSPGKGNFKLLVLHGDGVAIWDIKEMEFINELKVPRDMMEPIIGIDWAASDRVIITTKEGGIKLMGLGLAGSASSAFSYSRQNFPSCPVILPGEERDRLYFDMCQILPNSKSTNAEVVQLACSVDTDSDDGFGMKRVELSEHLKRALSSAIDASMASRFDYRLARNKFAARQLLVSKAFGHAFEKKLWTLILCRGLSAAEQETKSGPQLGRTFDILRSRKAYIMQEEEKCGLHLNRAADKKSRSAVTARLLCLGQNGPATQLLLDSDPEEEGYMADQMLACLIATSSSSIDESNVCTTKMVATKLIAEGQLWSGIQLLCLIGKVPDACTYLKASKLWEECLWLARCRLDEKEYKELALKYAEHLLSQGRIEESALLHASVGNWSGCLESLHLGQYCYLAAAVLHYVQGEEGTEPLVELEQVLVEAIRLEVAHQLFQISDAPSAEYYCNLLGDKGNELKKEFAHKI